MEQTLGRIARAAKILVACSAIVGPAAGAQIAWTNWTSFTPGATTGTATGTMGGVTVTYVGQVQGGSQLSSGGTQYFNPANPDGHTFGTSTYGANGPGANPGFIQLINASPTPGIGQAQVYNTLTFSGAGVNNLFFSLISVGQGGRPITYTFDNAFSIANQGSGWWGGCSSCLVQSGMSVTGTEGDGTLAFNEPMVTLKFTTTPDENWHGFTVGTTTTPEPSSMALLGTGLIGLVPMVRRRRK